MSKISVDVHWIDLNAALPAIAGWYDMLDGEERVLAQRFRFRLVPGRPIEPTAWTNIRPRHGMWMTVEPRAAASTHAA